MVGMELTNPCAPIVNLCAEGGVLVNCAAGNVFRYVPPLILKEKDIEAKKSIAKNKPKTGK
jgi:acetylornithine/succinyldiaminopimelate/putrescine aminotransferase